MSIKEKIPALPLSARPWRGSRSSRQPQPSNDVVAFKRFSNRSQQALAKEPMAVMSSDSASSSQSEGGNDKPRIPAQNPLLGQLPPVTSSVPVRLHIANLPFRLREHNLVQLFTNFGPVLDAEIICNDRGSKGFGFVTMARAKDAQNALARLNNSSVDGRAIYINLANPKKSALPSFDVNRSGWIHSNLVKAEARLKQAELEVQTLREELCSELGFRNVK